MSSNPTIITNVLSPNNPHITNFDPRERYVLQGILGEGGYGRVYQALDTVRQQLVAIKIIDLESAGDEVQDAHREIAVMANLHCPHLIQYYASYVINTNLWIVMEYLDAGSLLDIIKELGPLPESFIAYIIKEILLALQYLHHERKIHRDVKAGNLLVGSDGSVKLADFGVAGQLTDSVDKRQSKIGTPFWMAPEVITESKYDGGADIWSLGITAIELATGLPPYAQKVHPFRVILLIPKNPPPVLEGDFSETFKNFVASCLVKDPLQRPTATQLLEHPFVKDAVRSEGWKTFIAEKVMVNRYVPERDPSSELVRTGSNDSNCSNWNLTQKTAGSSSSRHRNAQIASSNSGNLNPSSSSFINVRTPRQGSISRGLAIENTNGFDDIIINSPRTPARNNSERNLEELMTINSHTPRGLMSPGHRQRQISSPRVPLPDDNLSLGGGSTRSRRGSGNSETLLILANNAGVSSVSSATASSGTGASNNNTSIAGSGKIHSNLMDSELTPPARVNPLRLPSTGFGINNSDQSFLPPLSNPSATNTNLIPEMIHVEPTSSLYRDMHSSISNSSSRDYDAGSSLHDSRSQFSSFIQNPNQSLLSIRGVNSSSSQQLLAGAKQGLSDASKAKSMPNMNSSLTSSGSIAFPSLNNGPQPGVLGQDELITYFQSWKQKEDYYLNEIHRLKEENLRLRSISKPFLSTVSVLVRNTNKVGGVAGEGSNANGGNVSSSSFDHYLGTGNNSHNNSSNQLAAIFHSMNSNANTNTNATTNGGPGGGTGSAGGGHLKSSSSFKDIQSILSISSDDTTPGPSRSLSPAAVVRDDIFADLASTHPNHPLLQRQLASAASSTNSLLMPQQAPPPPDELQTKALTDHPSEEKKGEDDEGGGKEDNEDILLRQSSFQLPPLPPAHHQSSNSGVPLTISVSQSYDDGNHHHYQNPNFLKSEETVPYPVPVIERGTAPVNGGARVMGYGIGDPSRSLDSVHPSSMIADPRSHSLDSADFETKHPTIKQLLKTPKFATTPTSSNNPSSSELQAQHRKFLETIVEHHLQQPSFVSTTSVTAESGTAPSTGGEGGSGTVASSSNSGKTNQSGSVGSRLMEAVIKPTLQEVKQRIERNIYTPEVVASNKTAEKKEGQDDVNIGASEKAINKEAEIRKQQLENIWLLLATGFTALEKILSTPSAPSNDPSTTSTHNSGDPMQLSGTKDSTFKSVSVNGSEGSGSSSNMLVDFASLVTSFTLSELDEQP